MASSGVPSRCSCNAVKLMSRQELMLMTSRFNMWHTERDVRGHVSAHYNDVIMGMIASQIISLTVVYSTVYSGTNQRQHQSSTSLAFVRGIHRWPVNSPHKRPVTQKNVSIWWRHHDRSVFITVISNGHHGTYSAVWLVSHGLAWLTCATPTPLPYNPNVWCCCPLRVTWFIRDTLIFVRGPSDVSSFVLTVLSIENREQSHRMSEAATRTPEAATEVTLTPRKLGSTHVA